MREYPAKNDPPRSIDEVKFSRTSNLILLSYQTTKIWPFLCGIARAWYKIIRGYVVQGPDPERRKFVQLPYIKTLSSRFISQNIMCRKTKALRSHHLREIPDSVGSGQIATMRRIN